MNNVVTSWPIVPVYDFCNPKQWPTIPQTAFVEQGYPVYGANGEIGYYTEFNHEKPTVLITCRGATCGTINVCKPKSYVTGNAMALDDLDELRVSPKYLVYALRNGSLAQAITGTAQPQITRQSLTAISIPLPPLPEQRRIAEVLDRAEALRVKRRAALAQLDSLTQSLFLDLFGDPLLNPKEWSLRRLGEEVKLQGGYAFKSSDYTEAGVPLVKISNVQKDNIDWAEIEHLPNRFLQEFSEFCLAQGDLVLALTRPIIKSLNSVKIAVVRACDAPCLLNQRVGRFQFTSNSRLTPAYLLEYCRTKSFFRAVQRFCSESLQPNMSTSQVESIEIPVPPIELQREFARRVDAVEKLKTAQRASLAELYALFATLQHRAFRGEL